MASSSNGIDRKLISELTQYPKTRLAVFQGIEPGKQGYTLLKLSPRVQKDILNKLTDDEILALLNPLAPDKATDIIQIISSARSKKITDRLNETVKEKVEFLLKFNPKAAAGLMNLNYIIIERNANLESVIKELNIYEQKTGTFPTILIVDDGKLVGELPGSTLALHHTSILQDKNIKKIPSVRYDSEVTKVVNSFVKNPHNKVVVLDQDDSVLGIIHSNDILRLIDKNEMRDLYGFAGVDTEEGVLDSALTKVKYRYKWLIINLGTAFLAASIVGMFEGTISRITLLAVYMPIVAGMGGNAATQALAVAVRGLVLKEVDLKSSRRLVINEMVSGAINGIINGVIVALIATFVNHSPMLGLVLAIAMVANLVTAGFFGALVPMIMKSLGKDPASSATIFITTATDVIGFFVFLGLASIML
ncbi:MAG: magnesium transporter [Candidatus Levybacteria bacterium]|nr:magnesium transporter [Candidatus Levybacteria bacterium]